MGFAQDAARFLIVLFSNFPMGVTGFGDAIIMHVALTLCGLSMPDVCVGAISEAVFNLTIGGLGAMGVQAALIIKFTNWKLVGLLLPPVLVGTFAGMALLYHVHGTWLKHLLGVVFVTAALQQIFNEVKRSKLPPLPPKHEKPLDVSPREVKVMGVSAGLLSGFLAGLFGTGGPPLMVFVATFEVNKDEWRASNAVIWFVDNILRFVYIHWIQKEISLPRDTLRLASLLVAGGLGAYAGSSMSPRVNMDLFRRLIIVLLLLGANVMLFAGAPLRLALTGTMCILVGMVLYALALWNSPIIYGGGLLPMGWTHGFVYSKVSVDEEGDEELLTMIGGRRSTAIEMDGEEHDGAQQQREPSGRGLTGKNVSPKLQRIEL